MSGTTSWAGTAWHGMVESLLREHWDRPRLEWSPGRHVIHFGRGSYLGAMRTLTEDR